MKRASYFFSPLLLIFFFFTFFLKYIVPENQDNPISKIATKLYNRNDLHLHIGENLSRRSISIEDNSGNQIYWKGIKVGNIDNEYGHTVFYIYKDGQLVAEAGHFKTNWWHTHSYEFDISQDEEIIKTEFRLKGPNASYDYFIHRR